MSKKPDEVREYLKRIGTFPLLSPSKELEYAKQVHRMMSCLAVKKALEQDGLTVSPLLWASELALTSEELSQILERGKRAKDKMITANLRLVVSVAKKYVNHGLDFLDLIQEGNIGLMLAVEKFDPRAGCKFSTFAYHWIRQGVTRGLTNQCRTIRLPVHIHEAKAKVRRETLLFRQEQGRLPTRKELANRLDITVEKLLSLQKIGLKTISLEHPYKDNVDRELINIIPDEKTDGTKVLEDLGTQSFFRDLLRDLDKQEKDIIVSYYCSEEKISWEQIAQQHNLTRTKVEKIKRKAKEKMKRRLMLSS